MLLSLNWLEDFISLDVSSDELAHRLIMTGIEVEQITTIGHEWDHVIVGEIIDITPHPQADKLTVPTITAGNRTYTVVCGASNIIKGQKVPLALDGAQLPSGIKIKSSKIRGVVSQGMLCSEHELGLGEDASGIMILPPESEAGKPFADSLHLADIIFDLSITPNRPDCLSIIGLAREIAAILDVPFKNPKLQITEAGDSIERYTSVAIIDSDLCPRYTARIISDINIGPSPLWMRRRLEASGIRSINNAVDATNYTLLEYGQPLHAFDLELLSGQRIVVKRARDNDRFVTLDGTERTLTSESLMICDATQPVALAGIMGGLNSEVNSETKKILLESAYFLPSSIKKTSTATGLTTEASQRFEKGVDINGIIPALNRAASLIAQLCGGKIARGIIDQYPTPLSLPEPIQLSVPMTNRIIGSNLKVTDMQHILKRLHIQADDFGDSVLSATAPTFRVDIHEPIDLVEEIARLNGYENIPATYPQCRLCTSGKSTSQLLSSHAREILTSRGFTEVINYSFIDPAALGQINLSEEDERSHPLRILNPLSEAQSVLRTTLIPSLMCNLRENLRHKNTSVNFFEISSIFLPDTASQLPREQRHISGLAYGARFGDSWDLPHGDIDFFDVKGCVEILLEQCRIPDVKFLHTQHEPFLHPQHCLTITADNSIIGYLGEVHPAVSARFDIDKSAYLFDLDFDKMTMLFGDIKINFKPFPRYPSIYRDLALVIDEAVEAEIVRNAIISFKNKLIDDITLFDYFKGKSVPQGKKSLAYRVKFQSPNRSLTDEEVNKIQDKLIAHLSQEVGAELRH